MRNICNVVKEGQKVRRASQLILQEDALYHNKTTINPDIAHSHPGFRLDDIMAKEPLSLKHRKTLQVLLAQSVLFFPWSGQELSKTAIAFHPPTSGNDPTLDKPFATLLPDHDDAVAAIEPVKDEESSFKPYNNETLAALAILLLELEMGKPIEELQTPEDLGDGEVEEDGLDDFDLKYWTTLRVLADHQDNMYKGAFEAIDTCLRCDFEDQKTSLDDPEVLQQVYERIVIPLEQELWHGFEIKRPFLKEQNTSEKDSDDSKIPPAAAAFPTQKARPKKSVKISSITETTDRVVTISVNR